VPVTLPVNGRCGEQAEEKLINGYHRFTTSEILKGEKLTSK
jgi:hypothetical protein